MAGVTLKGHSYHAIKGHQKILQAYYCDPAVVLIIIIHVFFFWHYDFRIDSILTIVVLA